MAMSGDDLIKRPDPLRAVNHNLLPVLGALLRERSVTRAAQTLGTTQPAASAALARLRLILRDPLLVRIGRRMELSPRGEALLPQVEDLCLRLSLLWQGPAFDPATQVRRFSLTSPDYVQVVVAPPLIAACRHGGPGLSLRFLDVPVDEVFRRMIADIDCVISIRQSLDLAGGNFAVESLYHDSVVAVVGPRHRLYAATAVDRSDLDRDSYLVFVGGAQFLERRYDGLRAELGSPAPPVAVSQHYNALMLVAAQSDCVALIPRHLARIAVALMPLRIVDATVSDFVIDVCLAWDRRYENDAAHGWLRARLRDIAATMTASS